MNALTLESNDSRSSSDPEIGLRGKDFPSRCSLCTHYQLHGRRGGNCQLLNVTVQGVWKACSLALPPFAPSCEPDFIGEAIANRSCKLIK